MGEDLEDTPREMKSVVLSLSFVYKFTYESVRVQYSTVLVLHMTDNVASPPPSPHPTSRALLFS